jgi:hypothetical protein
VVSHRLVALLLKCKAGRGSRHRHYPPGHMSRYRQRGALLEIQLTCGRIIQKTTQIGYPPKYHFCKPEEHQP